MSLFALILRGAVFHWRAHLGVTIGSALTATVLVGALLVGDSVRVSLREQALQRIGQSDAVLLGADRFFQDDLGARVLEAAASPAGARVAPVLHVRGVALVGGGKRRANDVQVLGVDTRFFELSLAGAERSIGRNDVVLNERLARQLDVGEGDRVSFRVDQPSALPRDMAFATDDDAVTSISLKVTAVIGDDEFGRYSMQAHQVPPFNAYVDLARLQRSLDREGRANLLLAETGVDDASERVTALDAWGDALESVWQAGDAELWFRERTERGALELGTQRVFLDPPIADALPELGDDVVPLLVYFVNELRHGERATPYSTVGAVGAVGASYAERDRIAPRLDLGPDEIALLDWTAEDLGATVGDIVSVRSYVLGEDGALEEETREFTVAQVVPLADTYADPTLMPDFPGIGDSENCADWEPGVPVDLDKIRDKDETYWDDHRGTPKAYIALETAREWWTTRFGNLTSLRVPSERGDAFREAVRGQVGARSLGLFFRDVRTPALAAANPATDFGGLFLGLSLFLLVAALLLTTMLFVFGAEQRADQIGLLRAIGFRPMQVHLIWLGEAAVAALVGSTLGAFGGIGYTAAVLEGLARVWEGAVASARLDLHVTPTTFIVGALISALAGVASSAWALRHLVRRPAVALLQGAVGVPVDVKPARWGFVIAGAALLAAAGIALAMPASGPSAAGGFFGAGALSLIGGLFAVRTWLHRRGAATPTTPRLDGLRSLASLNTTRRPGRSVATVILLASGCFLVLSVGVHRQSGGGDPYDRSSGTGGFALYARSTLPVLHELTSEDAREAFALDEGDLADVEVVPFRVQNGDEASCLNLSFSQNPRLVGVDPTRLASREAFPFAAVIETLPDDAHPWLLLNAIDPEGAIPVIGDAASVQWALKKSVGDTIDYVDERGEAFRVRIVATLANTVLQGDLVMAERSFEQRFPSAAGDRLFLLDVPPERQDAVRTRLGEALVDVGLEVTPASARLAELLEVQNTYLLIFQTLGALGLLLGSAGLATVVARNVLERRQELATARAVGFSLGAVRRLVLLEHAGLLGFGLVVGAVSAVVAVVPTLRRPGDQTLAQGAWFFVGVALLGMVWIALATRATVRGRALDALRGE